MNSNTTKGNYAIPLAIIAAGALIAIALFFALSSNSGDTGAQNNPTPSAPTEPISGVQPDDHIKGSPDAKVVIVEYSDTECPFCKNHHATLQRIVDEYDDEDVAWV